MDEVLAQFIKWQKSPSQFIEDNWGLSKQVRGEPFIKGEMLTWQQAEIVDAVELAINGGKKQISVASGHGIGKSTVLAMLILWFLFCWKDARIPVTAPTQTQMYDVLWSEIQSWLLKMPDVVKGAYEYSTDYVRMKSSPGTWFARARTARKENPEALAGLHSDFMMLVVDEASGVPDIIFDSASSALTGENVIFIMISNPTRIDGYFHSSHHKLKDTFNCLQFSSLDSPIVDMGFVQKVAREHGEDSDEFGFRVLGQFPDSTNADDKGWMPLILEHEIRTTSKVKFFGQRAMGLDPSGEGKDTSEWVVRDSVQAAVVMSEKISSPKTLTVKTLTIMDAHEVQGIDTIFDNFGVGADVGLELGLMGIRTRGVNVGEPSIDKQYMNIRAELHWKMRKWIKDGGMIENDPKLIKELLQLRFRRNLRNQIQIMSKDDMKKNGWQSPNKSDALMLTFYVDFDKQKLNAPKNIPTMPQEADTYD